jgi:Xaa-Pro aminopeptidase
MHGLVESLPHIATIFLVAFESTYTGPGIAAEEGLMMFFDLDNQQSGLVILTSQSHDENSIIFHGETTAFQLQSKAPGALVMSESEFLDYIGTTINDSLGGGFLLMRLPEKSRHKLDGKFLAKLKLNLGDKLKFEENILGHTLSLLRVFKDSHEIEMMKAASAISSQAYRDVVCRGHWGELDSQGRPKFEWQVSQQFELFCRMKGADFLSPYKPIVAHNKNAAISILSMSNSREVTSYYWTWDAK